jgi:two-component system LytT family response regulator
MSSFPQDSWIANPVAIADQGAPIRVLVVEPDTVSRRLICSILENETDDTVLCVDSARLLPSIHDFRPDLVILDINTTSRTQASEYLGLKSSITTIITGYDATSLKRFSSIDGVLLIKPFDVEQVQIALDAAKSKMIHATTEIVATGPFSNWQHSADRTQFLSRVAAESGETIVLINVKDILWLQSCGNHIRLHLGSATHLVRQTVKNFQRMLDPRYFLRIHRNAIVNLDHVHEFFLPPEGNMHVKLDNGTCLPLRRANRSLLRKTLKSCFLG